MNDRTRRFTSLRLLAVTAGLFGSWSCGPDDTDSDVEDTETPVQTCEAGERASFKATQRVAMCEFWEGCPGDQAPFFQSRTECLAFLDNLWSVAYWDECEAAKCAGWLSTKPTCTSEMGLGDPSCDRMVQESP